MKYKVNGVMTLVVKAEYNSEGLAKGFGISEEEVSNPDNFVVERAFRQDMETLINMERRTHTIKSVKFDWEDQLPESIRVTTEPETTDLFWDCECDEEYIHPRTTKFCHSCWFHADEQPDSKILEVSSAYPNVDVNLLRKHNETGDTDAALIALRQAGVDLMSFIKEG